VRRRYFTHTFFASLAVGLLVVIVGLLSCAYFAQRVMETQ
jgi:hypothetical protein